MMARDSCGFRWKIDGRRNGSGVLFVGLIIARDIKYSCNVCVCVCVEQPARVCITFRSL